jgi:hypothetical protein
VCDKFSNDTVELTSWSIDHVVYVTVYVVLVDTVDIF